MDLKNLENVECVFKPPVSIKGTRFEKFLNLIRNKYNVKLDGYWDLHKWSVENISDFWSEVWSFNDIKCSKTFDQVVDLSVPMSSCPKWFTGARLNIVENLLRFRDDVVAITAIGEDRQKRVILYSEVYEEAKLYAAAFRKFGLKKGDRVVCYMSNREEAIFAMLGAASIGAIWVGVLPLLGAQAVLDRVKQVNPRVLVAGDRIRFNGQETDLLSKVKVISKDLPTLEKVIIVPTMPNSLEKDISEIPKSCFLQDFLSQGRNTDGSVPDIVFEQLPFFHPFLISYTSGTTGKSKAIVHDYGCLLANARDQISQEPIRNFNVLSVSPVGWSTWMIGSMLLFSGRQTILFEGSPYFLTQTYFWDLVDEFQIAAMFLPPSVLDDLEKGGYLPTKNHKLTHLRAIASGGSVVKPQNCDFVSQKIKPGLIFFSVYASTEANGVILPMHFSLPVHKGEVQCPALGIEIECLNSEGKPVIGELGNLVITKATLSLPSGIYGDTDGSTFKEKYFPKDSNKFDTGDIAAINPFTKGIIIFCRSDEILNQRGWRFGSIEIYNIVNKLPEIHDSLCAAQYNKNRDERAILFLQIREGYKFDDELLKKVKDSIENELTKQHVPEVIVEVPEIPYNINGKKMELLVKKIINGLPYNPEVVINKDCLKYFKDVPAFLE